MRRPQQRRRADCVASKFALASVLSLHSIHGMFLQHRQRPGSV